MEGLYPPTMLETKGPSCACLLATTVSSAQELLRGAILARHGCEAPQTPGLRKVPTIERHLVPGPHPRPQGT